MQLPPMTENETIAVVMLLSLFGSISVAASLHQLAKLHSEIKKQDAFLARYMPPDERKPAPTPMSQKSEIEAPLPKDAPRTAMSDWMEGR